MKILIVVALAIIVGSQIGDAKKIKCFICGDLDNSKTCPKEEDKWDKKECESGSCGKLVTVQGDKTTIVRKCGEKSASQVCTPPVPLGNGKTTVTCNCYNEELCNGSFTNQASIVVTMILVTLSSILLN